MEETQNTNPSQNNNPAQANTNTAPAGTELVDIDLKKKPPEEKTQVSFADFDVDQHVAQKTESEVLNKQNAEIKGTVTPEVKRTVAGEIAKLNEEEKKYSEQFTVEDFEDLASGIIDAFDILMGWVLWRYSLSDPKKSSTSEYKIPEEKLKRLKTILAKILMKMNMKFPLWGTLAMVAVFTYLPAATKANAIRGENIKKREEEEQKNPKKTTQKAIGSATETRRIVAKTNQGEQIEVTAPAPVAKEYIPEKKQVVINTPPPPPPPPPPPVRKQVIPAKIEKPGKKSQSDDQIQEQTVTPPPPPAPVIRRVPRTGQKTRGGSHKA